MAYDSTKDTQEHIAKVAKLLEMCSNELNGRGINHDASKLVAPEKPYFDKYTPELVDMVYGTEEYKESCKRLKPALEHHYANNSHHPQYTFANEKWLPIKNYEDTYEVSNLGRIRRISKLVIREKQGNFLYKRQLMKAGVTPKGYLRLRLQNGKTGNNFFVHTLVAQAFLGDKPTDTHQVNHINGDKLNNNINNLEYVTPSENVLHAYDNNLMKGNIKYVVKCKEFDIITFGTDKMAEELRKRGYNKIASAGIYRCIISENTELSHYDLHFESWNIDEYKELDSPVNGMNLFDIVEMLMDWKASGERGKDGNIHKSLEINAERFGISKQLKSILNNTIEYLKW